MPLYHRKQERVDVSYDVLINNVLKCKGLNLSEGGMYVHTGRSFRVSSIVEAAVRLKGTLVKIKARVQHAQEGVGMGLMFINPDDKLKALIKEHISAVLDGSLEPEKKKVLLVDDTESARRMNKSRLILDGFEVVEAGDGLEAMGVLYGKTVDAVVLDLQMEKMDGFKVLASIQQTPRLQGLPVLVVSAKNLPEYVNKAMSLGATAFLPKITTSPMKLSEKLKEIFDKQAAGPKP